MHRAYYFFHVEMFLSVGRIFNVFMQSHAYNGPPTYYACRPTFYPRAFIPLMVNMLRRLFKPGVHLFKWYKTASLSRSEHYPASRGRTENVSLKFHFRPL